MASDSLLERARAWAQDDPEPRDSAALTELIGRVETGDESAREELADRFSTMLTFGTAGLRGELGAGPARMNRAIVMRAAAALVEYLRGQGKEPHIVIGYDARHGSRTFALDTAAIVVGAGGRAQILPEAAPTPVLAYATRSLGADAGVMVTASHNPAPDNGYKIYLSDGAQITPDVDAQIAAGMQAIESVQPIERAQQGWETIDEQIIADYLAGVAKQVPAQVSESERQAVSIVYTPVHGVGTKTAQAAFRAGGFAPLIEVPEQAEPDPDFPTAPQPNPEMPGVLDLALALAQTKNADLVLANDPDADRLGVAIPEGDSWRVLNGNEIGVLLGAHLLADPAHASGTFANSIVSSRLLAKMCAAAGVAHEQTLTGFKWISRVPGLTYGYEEALGYCVSPEEVKDKDGISAALVFAALAAEAKQQGHSLLTALDDAERAHGVHATGAFSLPVAASDSLDAALEQVRPSELAGVAVTQVAALRELPVRGVDVGSVSGVQWLLADDSRVIIRPSGTEPKLKVYLEVIEPVGGDDLAAARAEAALRLSALTDAVSAQVNAALS